MTKLKQAAKSRKTLTTSVWLTFALAIVSAAAANWPALKGAISPEWWFAGTVTLAAVTAALHHWQGRA